MHTSSSIENEEQFTRGVFSKGGMLDCFLENYEERQEQKEMALQVLAAYKEKTIALIEAGTGTGKSFAYLVPALVYALKHKEKTVVSTHTIALQEQLLEKDIPLLLSALNREVKVCLVKGMRNYLCRRKLKELQEEPLLIPSGDMQTFRLLEQWSEKTLEGSKSAISFPMHEAVWDKVSADAESCNHMQCPHYKKCFFFKARDEAEDAQVLLVNHALLFADIQLRQKEKEGIIPSFERLILDEAHHIEHVAQESSAQRMDRLFLIHNLLKIHSDVHPERSRLSILKSDLLAFSLYRNGPKNREFGKETSQNSSLERATSVRGQGTSEDKNFEKEPTQPKTNSLDQFGIFSNALSEMIEMHIPGQIRLAIQLLDKAFQQWRSFLELHAKKDNLDGFKLRLKSPHSAHSFWNEHIVPASKSLAQQLSALGSSLLLLGKNLETFKDAPGFGKISNHILEIQSIAARINEAADFALHFISGEFASERIRWIEVFRNNIILFEASLDISAFCQSHLFSTQKSAILCSATLAAGGSFTYVKERLGLTKEISSQSIYDSPFDFASRSLFLVPTDLPFPNAPDYFPQHIFTIEQAIEKSRGSVFVLFTSYDMLSQCYDALSSGALSRKYPFLRQGELPRHVLLQKFKSREGSVLFGTDSFWEGVDVPGEALRCVIISKLPFPVPSEPFYEAHAEVMEKEGKDSFLHYAIPLAVIKFKQGFGRLLRTKKDRGCILCLDPRLAKKNYGKHFLNSLPPSRTFFDSRDKVLAEMERFYHF